MWYRYSESKMVENIANSGDPDQMTHFAASDLGLHCLPTTLLGDSRLQWVMLSTLAKAIIFSGQHLQIFFLFFLENSIWHFMQIVS